VKKVINLNNNWTFIKEDVGHQSAVNIAGDSISIPHTWNGLDGQDGGNDYYRGKCWYVRKLNKKDFELNECTYLEFKGVNASAQVYINGNFVGEHHGGYSTFRFDVTNFLSDKNIIVVGVDNSKNDWVYPQTADFTFYGGIYRDVNIISVSKNHFDLGDYGSKGAKVTCSVEGDEGIVQVDAKLVGSGTLKTTLYNHNGKVVAESKNGQVLKVKKVCLWQGLEDPYLYKLRLELLENETVMDHIEFNVGFRSYRIDPDKGFYLNGKEYPLRGVCRHQDRPEIGNALKKEHHDEDIEIIKEIGANTIRLAHYQHDDYFYDLCDKYGFVVWAEIPYISKHMNNASENAISQMKELITQLYHHPSIVCWGISNEICMYPAESDRYDLHVKLNDLCHEMDPSRQTAIAVYMPTMIYNKLNAIPDIVSYNLYFGWYFPFVWLAGVKLDRYHNKYPNRILGLAEYGAEAMPNIHRKRPYRGDNTEEYQTIYHEKMIKVINERPYIWATHIWNMFDFGSDARNQGGEPGMNHKGLVTFDRKIKKDSFYLYKSYWSKEPFIHLCGKRFINRTGKSANIKIYSNQEEVELYNNNKLIGKQTSDKIFKFKIDLEDINQLVVKSGDLKDEMTIIKVNKKDKSCF
jgi:beta-galactosidase